MPSPNIRSSIQGKLVTLKEALSQLPGPEGQRFAELFKHGSLSVEIYAPIRQRSAEAAYEGRGLLSCDGYGEFVFGDQRVNFEQADFLFAPAGVVHRFEKFTDDLVVWVIFYGPEGGECS